MSRIPPKKLLLLRLLAASMSVGLFAYLVWRVGPTKLWENLLSLGWGFMWVIALAGISHVAKTWAWRLTFGEDKRKVSFARMLGLRLGAEAAGQLGLLGQTFGDSVRVSRLTSEIPIANGVASVTLDRGLYAVTAAMTTVAGILAALPLVSLSYALRLYAGLFVLALTIFMVMALLAMRKRWPLFSGGARILSRVSSLKNWIENRYVLIESVENALFDFHHDTPKAFWVSFSLNVLANWIAVFEVCLVLWLMGVKIGFFAALGMEALIKLLNVMGNFNPGNIGTYEGGTMLIGKMFGLSSATGLALGLARRLRSFFWAAIGLICFFTLSKPKKHRDAKVRGSAAAILANGPTAQANPKNTRLPNEETVAILFWDEETSASQRESLVRVGSLPILLRTILGGLKAGLQRIWIMVDPIGRPIVQQELVGTKRLPESIQWIEAPAGTSLLQRLSLIGNQAGSKHFVLIAGNATYHPSLFQKAAEWNDDGAAVALTDGDEPIGIFALSAGTIRQLADDCTTQLRSPAELYSALRSRRSVISLPVPGNLWQRVITPEDRVVAEQKLDRWLVKPTDGIYARLNRRISIPISRQLIKYPITANMVSVFTLGVGFASGAFFAYGGYWNTVVGAFLSLCASILDGCDGEVARLKLQESAFGCWLETVCDYLFYLSLFVGMTLGLWRNSGSRTYLVWGCLLLFGAIASFLATGWERHRLAAGRPEKLLGIWQAGAESRRSNPFLFLGRHTEFMIRRCFFPYALFFFGLFNIMNVAFVLSAIAANLVWPIALYSACAFAGVSNSTVRTPATSL